MGGAVGVLKIIYICGSYIQAHMLMSIYAHIPTMDHCLCGLQAVGKEAKPSCAFAHIFT